MSIPKFSKQLIAFPLTGVFIIGVILLTSGSVMALERADTDVRAAKVVTSADVPVVLVRDHMGSANRVNQVGEYKSNLATIPKPNPKPSPGSCLRCSNGPPPVCVEVPCTRN